MLADYTRAAAPLAIALRAERDAARTAPAAGGACGRRGPQVRM